MCCHLLLIEVEGRLVKFSRHVRGQERYDAQQSIELAVTDGAQIERRNKFKRTMWCHVNHGLEGTV